MTIDINRIMGMLPHRYPMLLIDRVLSVEPGERVVALKNVTINEPYFAGHFPGHPVMPGVLIIEAMAQASALLVVEGMEPGAADGKVVYFMSVDGGRFRRPVVPGDALEITATRAHARGVVWRFDAVARVDGQVAAQATITAMLRDA